MGGKLTCTGCGQKVVYDEETKLHHCGKCIRLGERVEWSWNERFIQRRLTGTVTAYMSGAFDGDRVLVKWDHHPDGTEAFSESRDNLRHIGVLDQIVEAMDA